ncbi:MAG: hypothetical protein ACYCPQ_07670 [Elusimicrobiota bacterium]
MARNIRARVLGAAFLLVSGVLRSRAAAGKFELGWRPAQVVLRWKGSSGDGYAGAVFENRAFIAGVSTLHAGTQSYSVVRFTTNRSGKWESSFVAKIKDDPNTGGQTLPQIAVIPASGHVVIVVSHPTSSGSELLSFTNQSGAWESEPFPAPSGGVDGFVSPSFPSLAAGGSQALLAFNASVQDQNCPGQGGYIFLSRFKDGAKSWSSAKNVTADYCGAKGGFAKDPVLALSSATPFIAFQCAGDPNGSPGAMCLRSGDLGGASEEIVETNTPDWGLAPGQYALSADASGAPHLAYVMNQNNQLRLMAATKEAGVWRRSQIAEGGSRKTGQVLSLAPAIAAEGAGSEMAYVGYAQYPLGGNDSQAIFMLRDSPPGKPSKPWNFTRSRFSDAAPTLIPWQGLLHIFIERDGQSVLWSREEPIPLIKETLTQTGSRATLEGDIAPAASPEQIRGCLEKSLGPGRWTPCRYAAATARPSGGKSSFSIAWTALDSGNYRARAQAGLTDDHLARFGAWRSWAMKAKP